ncbi:MAG: FAD:protein FMN transferase [Wenzhouxiangellaceae bacterium]|nr:FAD:protein FMN transferase [Wenzhouxiangellaceae bacterium]
MPESRRRVAILGLLLVLVACSESGPRLVHLEGHAQGTSYRVSVVVLPGHDSAALHRALERELVAIDRLYSNWREDSAVERFNAYAGSEPFEVGSDFVGLIEKALGVHRASAGCFDPTVGPLMRAWGLRAGAPRIPSADERTQLRASTGLDRLQIVDATHIAKQTPAVQLDLAGIAQGDSLARLADIVEADGISAYMIELGGEIVVRGARPDGPWRIAVFDPGPEATAPAEVIEHDSDQRLAIATSGTYQHVVELDGRRYSHILDPRSARPVEHDTVSVTVLDDDPALADAWSTALLCLGQTSGSELADKHAIAALFVQRDGHRSTTRRWSGR